MKLPAHKSTLARCVFGLTAFLSAAAFSQDIDWIDNYPEALAQAKQSGKPILLTFRCVP